MREKLQAWLWAVLGAPILAHLDKKIEYHAMVTERRLLTEIGLSARQIERLRLDNQLIAGALSQNHAAITGQATEIMEHLKMQATLQETEAVHFAAEKLILDREFWRQANPEARINSVSTWARIYCAKNNWPMPDEQKLRELVCAKLEQITQRKVGPTQ